MRCIVIVWKPRPLLERTTVLNLYVDTEAFGASLKVECWDNEMSHKFCSAVRYMVNYHVDILS